MNLLTFSGFITGYLQESFPVLTFKKTNNNWLLLPVWGILLFIVLYIVAAYLYPGGSDADQTATAFSWQYNYWCELMDSLSQNGEPNTARPVAIIAMTVLAISLIIFWNIIPLLFPGQRKNGMLIRISGSSSMLVMPLLLAGWHDSIINIAALLGCVAIMIVLVNLFRNKMFSLFWLGVFCLLLCGVNNYVYYSKDLLHHLPIIQKISFLVFLLWFVLLNLRLRSHLRHAIGN